MARTSHAEDCSSSHELFMKTVRLRPEETAYRWHLKDDGTSESVTWRGHSEAVREAARGLIGQGVRHGDRVAILGNSCYRWALVDMAILSIGAVTVGIYHSTLAGDCAYILRHSGARLLFAEDESQVRKIMSVRRSVPRLKRVILMRGAAPAGTASRTIAFDEFLRGGKSVPRGAFDLRAKKVKAADLATIVYTSGTTGVPKGAMITHENIVFTSRIIVESTDARDGDDTFLFLPLAHIFARADIYACIRTGTAVFFFRTMDTVIDDIRIARPHWFPCVPRVFEKIYSRIIAGIETKGPAAKLLFRWACGLGGKVSDAAAARRPASIGVRMQHRLADRLIFSRIREALGGRVRFCVSGAAPLNAEIARFFHGAGVLILEGYGMTENMSFTNVNRIDRYRFGSVGQPGPGIEQKIAPDGEILFRGKNVMKGYYRMPRETARTIDRDGWLHTGDLGAIDRDGFLTITGRKKDLIITSGGKNIAPARIEALIEQSPYINQVCLVGDRRNYVTALISVDPATVGQYFESRGIAAGSAEELPRSEAVVSLVRGIVDDANRRLASYETVKKFILVPEFTIDNGLATPTMKLKKNVIADRYRDEIEKMYRS